MSRKYPLDLTPARVPDGFPGRVDFIKSASKLAEAPHSTLPEVCFCGRSNVGKSSLLNSLCNRKQLARVSSTPGRTRLINFFNVQDKVAFVDLPGYGWAKVPKSMMAEWGRTIQAFLDARPQLRLALLLVDMRRDPKDEERNLLAWFRERDVPCLIIATKSDKVPSSRQKNSLAKLAKALGVRLQDIVPFSALSKKGREAVWGTLLASIDASFDDGKESTKAQDAPQN